MKKTISITLLLCLFLNSGGYWLYIKCMQAQRRNEVKAALRLQQEVPGQEVFEFAVQDNEPTDPAFERENSNEFYLHGKLYDIIEQQITGNKLRIRCIEDSKEENLLKNLEQVQRHQQGKNGKDHSVLQQLISFVFIGTEPFRVPQTTAPANEYFSITSKAYAPVCTEVNTPPPRA